MASPTNSINFGRTSSINPAFSSIPSFILVRFFIFSGTLFLGFTNSENLSTIRVPCIFIAPISIISCSWELRPVVSKSNTTNVSSSILISLGFVIIGLESSTIYISQPKITLKFSSFLVCL